MKNKKLQFKATDFNEYLAAELKNPKFRKYYDEYGRQLELAYKILQMRKAKKISQLELAKKIGTTQSNVARLESGQQNFTLSFLGRIAVALDAKLEISLTQ